MRKEINNKSKIQSLMIIIIVLFSMNACSKKTNTNEKKNTGNVDREFPVLLETAELKNLEEYITVSGTLEGKTDISLLSESSGKIVEIYKKLGDWVSKGTAIGRVDNSDYESTFQQAKASLVAAEASFESAELNYTSSESLFKKNQISQSEYSNAKSAYKNALANHEGAKARVEQARKALENSRFVTPVSGQIVDLPVQIGQTVSPGVKIAGIVDTKNLLIKTGVGESFIRSVKQSAPVSVMYKSTAKEYSGKISGIGLKPLNSTANYPIEISLVPNSDLLPGMVVDAKILSNVYRNVIYTSLNNLIQEYDQYYVFIVDEQSIARKVPIKIGAKVNESVIILEGIKVGDRIVYEGMENLESGTKVSIRN
jgi:RND family efflux transporter MFP subunit